MRLWEKRSLEKALDSELHSNISEYREHSHKLQDNGKPTDNDSAATRVKRTFSRDLHLQHSECREHSPNSRIQESVGVAVTVSAEDAKTTAASSDFSKHSQNSLSKGKPNADPGEVKATFGDPDGRYLRTVSEF